MDPSQPSVYVLVAEPVPEENEEYKERMRREIASVTRSMRPELCRSADGRFRVRAVPEPATEVTAGFDNKISEFEEDGVHWTSISPAKLSLSDSNRALGSYRAEAAMTEKRIDTLRLGFSAAQAESAKKENNFPLTRLNASVLTESLYKAWLAPHMCLLASSIASAVTEEDNKDARKLATGILNLQPGMYDEFKRYRDFKNVRTQDGFTLESQIMGKKTPEEVVAWMHTDRSKMVADLEAESTIFGYQERTGMNRNYGDILWTAKSRPAKLPQGTLSPRYVTDLVSSLGGSKVATKQSVGGRRDTKATLAASQPTLDDTSTPDHPSNLQSLFDAVAVRKFLARDCETDEQGFTLHPFPTYRPVMPRSVE